MKQVWSIFLPLFILLFTSTTIAQTLNQTAVWGPGTSWTLTGSYNPAGLIHDPLTTTNFGYSNVFPNYGSGDCRFESPVIDLTSAANQEEYAIYVNLDYVTEIPLIWVSPLRIEYYDADAGAWYLWYELREVQYGSWFGGTGTNTCTNMENETSACLNIESFSSTQLTGFKYRLLLYEDVFLANEDNEQYLGGFCMDPPTILSTFSAKKNTILEWTSNFGNDKDDRARGVEATMDGGCVIVGSIDRSLDQNITPHYSMVKIDATGNSEWGKDFGVSYDDFVTYSVKQLNDESYIISGDTIRKLDVLGNIEWSTTFRGFDLQIATDGNYYCFKSPNPKSLAKLDQTGNILWTLPLYGKLAATSDGGCIVGGTVANSNVVLTKVDANGNIQWTQTFDETNALNCNSITQTNDGNYVVAGLTITGFEYLKDDFWVMKVDVSGNLIWEQKIGGIGYDVAHSVIATDDGGCTVSGQSNSASCIYGDIDQNNGLMDFWTVKFDAAGNIQWEKNHGGNGDDIAYAITQGADGSYFIAGGSASDNRDSDGNNGGSDMWVVKFRALEDDCFSAKTLQLNSNPCDDNGAYIDYENLTAATIPHNPSCGGDFPNTLVDAWYKVEVPPSGNFLIRATAENTIAPIVEAYTGDCNSLVQLTCQPMDTIPYAMIFENYAPGSEVIISIWDKTNTTVNSGNTAALSISAHILSSDPTEWEICDFDNYQVSGNPTNLADRDINNYILEFEEGAPLTDIATAQTDIVALGDSLLDECTCGGRTLQLWGADTPIQMEGNKRGARSRASVDTTNYNYVFEALEFQVNAYSSGEQEAVDIGMDVNGNFVMTWSDKHREHNYGRVYSSSGNPLTSEFQIGTSNTEQSATAVAMQDNGDFVAVWVDTNPNTPGKNNAIYGRQYHANGNPKNAFFDISLAGAYTISSDPDTLSKYAYGYSPKIATDATGNFVVAWHVGSNIFFQLFDNTAATTSGIEIVNVEFGNPAYNSASPPNLEVAMNASGDFVIAWNGVGTEQDIYFQRYDNTGTKIGTTTSPNLYTLNKQTKPSVALADNGTATFAWQSFGQDADKNGIYWRQYDSSNTPIYFVEQQANSFAFEEQLDPSVAVFDDNTFIITWSSYHEQSTDGSEENIYGRLYNANGNPNASSEFLINQIKTYQQLTPKVVTNGNTIFSTAWEDRNNDGSYKGIYAQRYEVLATGGVIDDYYSIGTATPSTLLGEELAYPSSYYSPSDSVAAIRVAVIDTGIEDNHPAIAASLWNNQEANDTDNCQLGDMIGYDFINEVGTPLDLDGHGTNVNGIITRDFDSNLQLEMMNLKFHELETGKVFDALCAIYYAVDNGVKVMNLSWGFEASEYPTALREALDYASSNDVLIVTTAGNTSKNNDIINKYPANLEISNMVVVTSYTIESGLIELSNYASYGATKVDIAARGFVETATIGGNFRGAAGTSLAAPAVSRTAATIRGLYPILTAAEVKDCILNTAQYESNLTGLVLTNGILDHDAALECARLKAGDCIAIDLYISTNQNIDSTYRSDAHIGSNATLSTSVDLEYLAADSICLDANFSVPLGAAFLADIEDCDPLNSFTGSENDALFRIQEDSPHSGKIKANFQAKAGAEISIRLLNSNKKLLEEWQTSISKNGQFEKIIDVHRLPAGLYYIEYSNGNCLVEKAVQVE